ncbi:unnamed protein product [Laminaria digitata]
MYFHKRLGGWELPTLHCMVVAVGKGIGRAYAKSEVRLKVRKPLTWDPLTKGVKRWEPRGGQSGADLRCRFIYAEPLKFGLTATNLYARTFV